METTQIRTFGFTTEFLERIVDISRLLSPIEDYFGMIKDSVDVALDTFNAINEDWTLYEASVWEIDSRGREFNRRFPGKPHQVVLNHSGGGGIRLGISGFGKTQFQVFKSSENILGQHMVRFIGLSGASGFYINMMPVGNMLDFCDNSPDWDERLIADEDDMRARLPKLTGLEATKIAAMGEDELRNTWAIAQLGAVATTKTAEGEKANEITIERLDWEQTFDAFDAPSDRDPSVPLTRRRSNGIILTDTRTQE